MDRLADLLLRARPALDAAAGAGGDVGEQRLADARALLHQAVDAVEHADPTELPPETHQALHNVEAKLAGGETAEARDRLEELLAGIRRLRGGRAG